MDWMTWTHALLLIPRGIVKLLWYFQAPGTLSVLGWLSALILVGFCYRRKRFRHVAYTVAVGLALLGFVFGQLNSGSISRIRTDVSDTLNEARKAQEEATRKQVAERRRLGLNEDIRFVEESASDVRERAKQADARKSIYELAAEGKMDQVEEREAERAKGESEEYDAWAVRKTGALPTEARPAKAPKPGLSPATDRTPVDDETALQRFDYRKGAKKQRAANRKEKVSVIQQIVKKEEHVGGRLMKESDVMRAQRLDRINLVFCRASLWITLLMLLADYFFRANQTFWTVWPLPVAGRLLDYFHPKRHAVLVEKESRAFIKGYLETAIRKGESFLYFGEEELWQAPALLRLRLPPLPEACSLIWDTCVWTLKYVATGTATGYLALMAGKNRRVQEGESRGAIVVRLGDLFLGLLDRVVLLIGLLVRGPVRYLAGRFRNAILTLRLNWVTAQARYPLCRAPVAMALYVGHEVNTSVRRRRRKGGAAPAGADMFLLGRIHPDQIGRAPWWRRGWLGALMHRGAGRYRCFSSHHPRWQEWVERQWGRCRRLEAILFREGRTLRMPRLHYDAGSLPADRLFPLEAVWFNRYCCCITGRDAAQAVMPDLLYFLKYRLVPRARVWQTVNIVWDLDLPLDRVVVDELAFRCTECNLRLMVISRNGWAHDMADVFDEKTEEQVGRNDRIRIENMAVISDRMAEQQRWTA